MISAFVAPRMTVHRAEQHSFWHDDVPVSSKPTINMGLEFGRAKVSKAEVRQKLQRRVHRFLNLANLEADLRDGHF